MCGRFALNTPPKYLAEQFRLDEIADLSPRYNIAPTQDVAVVLAAPESKARKLVLMKWGLIPRWAKDTAMASKMINARAETAHEKPTFKPALKHRRCLIPADGFYEWKKNGGGKQPFFIRLKEEKPFAFAGLWDRWEGQIGDEESTIESCTILTTSANDLMKPLHDRMPVILDPRDYDLWLDPAVEDADKVRPLLVPYPPALMTSFPVSTHVNSPRYDDPLCIAPAETSLF